MGWDREKERKAGKKLAIGGAIFGLLFAIFWCITAASMGAWFMVIFGLFFIGMMGYRLYLTFQLAKEETKQDTVREQDPWERPTGGLPHTQNGFCPYCGSAVQEGFQYCPNCGRKQ